VREREAKAAVRDRSVAIGSPTIQCRRPDVNAPKRVFNDHIEYGHYVNRTAIGPLATANRRGRPTSPHPTGPSSANQDEPNARLSCQSPAAKKKVLTSMSRPTCYGMFYGDNPANNPSRPPS